MAENVQDNSDHLKNIGSRPSSAAKEDRELRIKQFKEKQNEERQKKLEEIKAQALAAQRFKEQKEMERRQRLEDLRLKEEVRRLHVEERKRAIDEAERYRLESIIKRNEEREARIEARRRNDRSSVFAFGSSTPRLLEPMDCTGSFWGHRGATSTQNITTTAIAPLTRRQSEREFETGNKKRATSASGLERSNEGNQTVTTPAGCVSGYVGRRRTDLMPTIPSRDSPSTTPRKPFTRSPAPSRPSSSLSHQSTSSVASSITMRIRPVTTPRKPRPISIAITGVTSDVGKNGVDIKKQDNKPPLPRMRKSSLVKSQDKSKRNSIVSPTEEPMRAVTSAMPAVGSPTTANELVVADNSGERTREEEKTRSENERQLIGVSNEEKRQEINATKQVMNTSKQVVNTREQVKPEPPVKENHSSQQFIDIERAQGSTPEQIFTPPNSAPEIKETAGYRDNILKKDVISRNVVNKDALNKDAFNKDALNRDALNRDALNKDALNRDALNRDALNKDALNRDGLNRDALNKDALSKDALNKDGLNKDAFNKDALSKDVVDVDKVVNRENNKESASNKSSTLSKENLTDTEIAKNKENTANTENTLGKENNLVAKENNPMEDSMVDMSASMSKIRITTEEEAKAALAERRRLAREEAERIAEMERLQKEEEARLEYERQQREEEQQRILIEQMKQAEQERLEEAIKEAKKREEEEKLRKEEEAKVRLQKEEADRKAREEAERQKAELQERLKLEEKEREARRKRVEAIMLRTRGKNNAANQSQGDDKNDENKPEKINGSKMEGSENGHQNGKDIDNVDNLINVDSIKNANTVSVETTLGTDDTINSNNSWQHNNQDLLM